ncbi:hypothetical protein Back2_04230 [Nocardioides baekrokdamisoli]|uniref:Uncharacterized protein n=1 Tax=Nocardioides baekrokdamisoli TaxID=1804624 RepID=A0A3G9ICR2_9ACTN|nr:hypothetical protein [Nocardioides baekrokdamisoli]BBH16136.1 hypothetical protein Back2_04230 [Nocardioides baekrokdamisoli]
MDADLAPPELRDFVPAVGAVVTLVGAGVAFVMALGAILVAANADATNGFVDFVYNFSGSMSLGMFKRIDGLVTFSGGAAATRDGLFNWGLGALVWLSIGYGLGWAIRRYGPSLIDDLPHTRHM